VFIMLIDGRAGSGKTTLARRLCRATGAELFSMDESYPGWDGLLAGSALIASTLIPHRSIPIWDWYQNRVTHTRKFERERSLIIEGCGALTRDSIRAAHSSGAELNTVWVECDDEVRKKRALERDGEIFAPHWQRWAEQENEHIRMHQPLAYAKRIIHTG
jgi:uridine kinase